jgi:cytidylate kinase|tara:strand:+ start:1449 stop:2132 length:684 start_codon:yes stop_codon:yes gene_type:complete
MSSNPPYIITIDGTSSSGKSTISRLLAKKLNFKLLDSGKLYRSVGYIACDIYESIDIIKDYSELVSKISLKPNNVSHEYEVHYKNKIIDSLLYNENIGIAASIVSKVPEVRKSMYDLQHSCVKGNGLIANGRDMGSEVFTDARLKIYITADIDIRARRRYEELINKGDIVQYQDIYNSLKKRDDSDMNRDISPLKVPDNAHILDTSNLKPNAIVDKILNLYTITSIN